jgi:transposase
MKKNLRFVGLDVHKDSITVAVAEADGGPGQVVGQVPNEWAALQKVLKRLGTAKQLRVCYEAGPTGFGLARRLLAEGIDCLVVAPSLIPVRQGCRIKTDRRDAVKLAQFLRSGDLVAVAIPAPETEALRDLVRAREDAAQAERKTRQQLDKFLLRHERIWSGATKWTQRHWAWIRQQTFAEPILAEVRQQYVEAVESAAFRVHELNGRLEVLVETSPLRPLVVALMALRGVRLVTAVTLAAEIGDFGRFLEPRRLMAFVGLVPSEQSTGSKRRQGSITRTGNRHVRWIITEAAWNYRFPPRLSRDLAQRRSAVSPAVRAIAEKAEQRLYRRFLRLLQRGKTPNKVVTAVARELLGFVWAIAQVEEKLAA